MNFGLCRRVTAAAKETLKLLTSSRTWEALQSPDVKFIPGLLGLLADRRTIPEALRLIFSKPRNRRLDDSTHGQPSRPLRGCGPDVK